MTKPELIDLIDNGRDILFDVSGKHFTVLTWTEGGISIVEQYPKRGQRELFQSGKELVDNFLVNDVPLEKLVAGVRITDYS